MNEANDIQTQKQQGDCSRSATGYALAKALRLDADDCPRPDRAQLMYQAAEEIERLIVEARGKAHNDEAQRHGEEKL